MTALPYDIDAACQHLSTADPVLARHVAATGKCTLSVSPLESTFEGLLRAIVYQQLSGKAAATIYGRVRALINEGDALPTAAAFRTLDDDALRGAGLSRAKLRAARDLADRVAGGILPTAEQLASMPPDEIHASLQEVRGVGPWTVQMLLIFRLGHPDILPLNDLGIRKGFQRLYGIPDLPGPDTLTSQAEAWRPYRSVASWYLWRAADGVAK